MNDSLPETADRAAAPPVTAPEGEFASVDPGAVDAQDLLVLARIAGLPVEPGRAAGLARELAATRTVVGELDALLRDRPTLALDAFAPFDPVWPPPPLPTAPAPAVATDGAGALDPA